MIHFGLLHQGGWSRGWRWVIIQIQKFTLTRSGWAGAAPHRRHRRCRTSQAAPLSAEGAACGGGSGPRWLCASRILPAVGGWLLLRPPQSYLWAILHPRLAAAQNGSHSEQCLIAPRLRWGAVSEHLPVTCRPPRSETRYPCTQPKGEMGLRVGREIQPNRAPGQGCSRTSQSPGSVTRLEQQLLPVVLGAQT